MNLECNYDVSFVVRTEFLNIYKIVYGKKTGCEYDE